MISNAWALGLMHWQLTEAYQMKNMGNYMQLHSHFNRIHNHIHICIDFVKGRENHSANFKRS